MSQPSERVLNPATNRGSDRGSDLASDRGQVLLIDDEADIRELVALALAKLDLKTRAVGSLREARAALAQRGYDLCITDMRLPDGNGIDWVRYAQQHAPQMPVAVITAYGSAQAAVDSLKAGAFDFVSKPVDIGALRKLADYALRLRKPQTPPAVKHTLLGEHPALQQLRGLIARVARSQTPVHISGESGSGKELVARMIHERGARAGSAFVAVNCGAIPTELMESELFGHLRGSFTGAHRDQSGLFQAAEGGTLFLDEVAELPLHMQVKLLRALQERSIRPVGAATETPVNVRIISATHQNLAARVADGSFRQDLYYRLNVIELRTPPLREHPSDIPLIAAHVLDRLSQRMALDEIPQLDDDAERALLAYPFPGNVRELENILERALTLSDGSQLNRADLQLPQTMGSTTGDTAAREPAAAQAELDARLDAVERRAILDALEKTRHNKTRAAQLLGMSFRSLRYRIKKLGLDEDNATDPRP